jgi:dienelactone hydrolase
MRRTFLLLVAWLMLTASAGPSRALAQAEAPATLPGTDVLTLEGELDLRMRQGIDRFLDRATEESIAARAARWQRDPSSREAYEASIAPNRERFRKVVGAIDERLPVLALEYITTTRSPEIVGVAEAYQTYAVRWPVLEGVWGEGLLLRPKDGGLAYAVALPDADDTPEAIAGLDPSVPRLRHWACRLAESGCLVLIPTLIDRDDTHAGNPDVAMTNQPHREWVYRPAFEFGRHIIGYEVEKILAAVDWFMADAETKEGLKDPRIGVVGYGEGGLVALYAAALDPRIDVCLTSGYFDSRQRLAAEPIYRNVWGLLEEFGDAEIASLVAPRALIVEHSPAPPVDGPPPPRPGRTDCAAPGALATPDLETVRAEIARLEDFFPDDAAVQPRVELAVGRDGRTVGPGSALALGPFLRELGLRPGRPEVARLFGEGVAPDPADRHRRQLKELVDYTQALIPRSDRKRAEFWSKAQPTGVDDWQSACRPYRDHIWDEVIGRCPPASMPINPRTRLLADGPAWTRYEVVLDVWPDVFCWGILTIPKGIEPGERRPVVVCQHGLEGVPADVVNEDPDSQAYPVYKGFASELAEQGFVTYAPHNFYRGGNEFRQLQRKLYPLKKTMFSIILAQHERHLDWLGELKFVDPERIGFYGLSYGGFTAIRVPPLLERYALSISSAEFNDMVKKKASIYDHYSYPFHLTYEVFEFNLGNTAAYGDLAGLMAPRPFMVERGHKDGVAPDEWVAAEYAKVRRLYAFLGIPERTAIEFFNGPHAINGEGTYEFLHRHLDWPAP